MKENIFLYSARKALFITPKIMGLMALLIYHRQVAQRKTLNKANKLYKVTSICMYYSQKLLNLRHTTGKERKHKTTEKIFQIDIRRDYT